MSKVKIGVKKFYYAKQTTEDTASSAAVYGTPVAVPGLRSVGVDVESETNTLFADDGPYETAVALGEITVSIELAELPLSVQADLLGHTYDSTNNTLVSKSSDNPPNVAIMFSGTTSDGGCRCVKLYKGKFSEPSDEYATKEDSVEYQLQSIEGKFVALKNNSEYKLMQDFASGESTDSFFANVLPA